MDLLTELLPVNVFVWSDNSIDDYIPDNMTNIIEIVNDIFSNNIYSFVILLIIVILMESSVKQQ
jgi:hypothetical protein